VAGPAHRPPGCGWRAPTRIRRRVVEEERISTPTPSSCTSPAPRTTGGRWRPARSSRGESS